MLVRRVREDRESEQEMSDKLLAWGKVGLRLVGRGGTLSTLPSASSYLGLLSPSGEKATALSSDSHLYFGQSQNQTFWASVDSSE